MVKLLQKLLHVEGFVAVTAYAVTAALLLADVVGRELFNYPIWGAQKIAVFGSIFAGIFGLSIAVANNRHLRANVADRLLPFKWVDRFGDLVSALIFAMLGWYAVEFVNESITFRDRVEVLNIPLWPFQLVFPYAFLASALRHFVFFMQPECKPEPQGEM